MSDQMAISVNFGRPMPLFPLGEVALLPQQVLPLHVFEPRYRQLVQHALDGAGQIAMAVKERAGSMSERAALRPAVCIGQIVQHERQGDGRYEVLLQGVCRARILGELPPESGRLYRLAMVEPVGLEDAHAADSLESYEDEDGTHTPAPAEAEGPMTAARRRIAGMLAAEPLSLMAGSRRVLEYINDPGLPTNAVLELVSFTIVTDSQLRYRLLEEARAEARALLIVSELQSLGRLINRARAQQPEAWPKGCSWN